MLLLLRIVWIFEGLLWRQFHLLSTLWRVVDKAFNMVTRYVKLYSRVDSHHLCSQRRYRRNNFSSKYSYAFFCSSLFWFYAKSNFRSYKLCLNVSIGSFRKILSGDGFKYYLRRERLRYLPEKTSKDFRGYPIISIMTLNLFTRESRTGAYVIYLASIFNVPKSGIFHSIEVFIKYM